jgi:fermentation-respiration switch protein FrsA (DUF1100 family)
VLVLAAALYAGVSAYAATQATIAERTLPEGTPADLGLAYEAVTFASAVDGIPLRGWYLPARGERAVILLHGLDGERWDRHPALPDKARRYVQAGFDVLTFDLRAHGESGGERVGLGWLERRDVQGATTFLEQRGIPPRAIGVHGHSYGAATALLSAAAIPDIGAVIADSAFAAQLPLLDQEIHRKTGLPALFTPGIAGFAGLFYGLDLEAMAPVLAVPQVAPRPILFIHGEADSRIPAENSRLLLAASRNPKDSLWLVPGAEHVEAFTTQPDEYTARMLGFFDQHLVTRSRPSLAPPDVAPVHD